MHTGDLTHGANPAEFRTLDQLLKGRHAKIFDVPGRTRKVNDDGKAYLERYGKNTKDRAGHSVDQKRRSFVSLSNVMASKGSKTCARINSPALKGRSERT